MPFLKSSNYYVGQLVGILKKFIGDSDIVLEVLRVLRQVLLPSMGEVREKEKDKKWQDPYEIINIQIHLDLMQEQVARVIARHADDLEIVLVATMCLVQIKSKGQCFNDKQECFDALTELNKSEDLKDIKHLLHKLI